jgi:N-acetylmuramoyl-L-alanine amidase
VCADGLLTEFQVNQNVATRVQADLEKLGYEVDLLREFDPLLNDYEALALVSIHADSCDYINDAATGYKVAASMANPRPERSQRLVACLRTRYGQVTGLPLHSTSVTDDMTSYHAFEEINPETTAAIIEVGFLNLDRKILTQNQDFIAKGITDGILCFVNNEDISP